MNDRTANTNRAGMRGKREKKGSVAVEILALMILVALTSAAVLWLVNAGIVSVRAEHAQVPLLNTEFIPLARAGTLVIKEFQFCAFVDEGYNCQEEKSTFTLGEEIHFRFVVETNTVNGGVMLVENYRLQGPAGTLLLEVDTKDNFHFDAASSRRTETVYFKDSLFTEEGDLTGKHTLELFVENPLLDKKVTLVEEFVVVE